jgi:hypothetical protein
VLRRSTVGRLPLTGWVPVVWRRSVIGGVPVTGRLPIGRRGGLSGKGLFAILRGRRAQESGVKMDGGARRAGDCVEVRPRGERQSSVTIERRVISHESSVIRQRRLASLMTHDS